MLCVFYVRTIIRTIIICRIRTRNKDENCSDRCTKIKIRHLYQEIVGQITAYFKGIFQCGYKHQISHEYSFYITLLEKPAGQSQFKMAASFQDGRHQGLVSSDLTYYPV